MPIRSLPFDAITAEHLRALVKREAREDRTLDFKQEMSFGDGGKLDLLQDVTAMANASGGMILYGIEEGDGDDRGMAVGIRALRVARDETELRVANLLRDGIDEPIFGLLHRAVQVAEGEYVYAIRVPPSANAPHMVKLKSNRARFWLRGTVSNDPMSARQIKESALRADSAFDRSRGVIATRRALLRERGRRDEQRLSPTIYPLSQAVVHVVPLFPASGGYAFSTPSILERLRAVPPLGRTGRAEQARISLEGFYCFNRHSSPFDQRYVSFLRDGSVEFHEYEVARWRERPGHSDRYFDVDDVERHVASALAEAQQLTDAGLLPTPVVVALSVMRVERSQLLRPNAPDTTNPPIVDDDVLIEPVIISDWAVEGQVVMRQVFDVLWQAWGYPRSLNHASRGMPDA